MWALHMQNKNRETPRRKLGQVRVSEFQHQELLMKP